MLAVNIKIVLLSYVDLLHLLDVVGHNILIQVHIIVFLIFVDLEEFADCVLEFGRVDVGAPEHLSNTGLLILTHHHRSGRDIGSLRTSGDARVLSGRGVQQSALWLKEASVSDKIGKLTGGLQNTKRLIKTHLRCGKLVVVGCLIALVVLVRHV